MADTETQQVDTAVSEDVAKETAPVANEESAGNEETPVVNGEKEAEESAPEATTEEAKIEQPDPESEDKAKESVEEQKEEQEEQKEEKGDEPKEDNDKVNGADTTPTAAPLKEENGTEPEKKDDDKTETEISGPFNGVFLHTKSENLEEFLLEIGIGWFMRKVALKTNPTMELEQRDNNFVIRMQIGPMTRESKFTIGQQYEDKDMSGELAKICARIEDGKLIQFFEPAEGSKGKALQITREIEGDQLTMTLEAGNVTSKRFFTRKT